MRDAMPPEAILSDYPPPMAALANDLRAAVRAAVPDVVERVRAGWRVIGYDAIDGRRKAYFAWIMVEFHHVHLGFVHGVFMHDPTGALGGDAKLARWLTFVAGDAIEPARLAPLIREARAVALLPRGIRGDVRRVDPNDVSRAVDGGSAGAALESGPQARPGGRC